MIECLDVS